MLVHKISGCVSLLLIKTYNITLIFNLQLINKSTKHYIFVEGMS